MLTIEKITKAHSNVKSGADFPSYIREIKQLGVRYYEVFVIDGQSHYYDVNNHKISLPAKYDPLTIADSSQTKQFKADLMAHQQGKTNYLRFCQDSAKSGIEKWTVHLENMTCSYYDKASNEIWIETIPG